MLVYAGFRGVSPLQALRDAASGRPAPVEAKLPATGAAGGSGLRSGTGLLAEMRRIGDGRKYSQLRRTGPDSYDCSGLVYKAGANLGLWPTGTTAFNTASFITHTAEFGLTKVSGVQAGDIIWWLGHMGVATDGTNFYSALNARHQPNIGVVSIAAIDKTRGPHRAYRFTEQAGAGKGSGGGGGSSW